MFLQSKVVFLALALKNLFLSLFNHFADFLSNKVF